MFHIKTWPQQAPRSLEFPDQWKFSRTTANHLMRHCFVRQQQSGYFWMKVTQWSHLELLLYHLSRMLGSPFENWVVWEEQETIRCPSSRRMPWIPHPQKLNRSATTISTVADAEGMATENNSILYEPKRLIVVLVCRNTQAVKNWSCLRLSRQEHLEYLVSLCTPWNRTTYGFGCVTETTKVPMVVLYVFTILNTKY